MLPTFLTNPDPDIFLSDNYLVLDFENTIRGEMAGARNAANELLFTCMKSPLLHGHTEVEGGELEVSRYLDVFYDMDFIVCHNSKYEIQWLHRAGLDTSKVLFYCTQIGEFVLAGNRKIPLDLNHTGTRYGCPPKENYVDMMMGLGECPSHYPQSLLADRCRQDVDTTHTVFKKQRVRLKEAGLLPVMFTRCIFTPVIADMEMNGMFLDEEAVYQVHKEKTHEYQAIMQELDSFTGGINMASPTQVAKFIYETLKFPIPRDRNGKELRGKPTKQFPDGLPKTNEDAINLLKPKTAKHKRFLDLKQRESKLRKTITSYTTKFVRACEEAGCMVYGNLNQTVVGTHRLSSSSPNLQNFDRKLKRLIVPRRPGWSIRQNDYDQLEFRVAGFLAQDQTLLANVLDPNFDAHAESASVIFGDEFNDAEGESRKELRTAAKSHTFKPLYGGQSGTPAERAYYEKFLDTYQGVAAWHEKLLDEALETKKMRTITGLIFYFPRVHFTDSGYVEDQTNVKNYPVQMFATADIAPIGVTFLWHRMKDMKLKSFLINEVHDSAIAEEHPDEHDIMEQLSHQAMEDDVITYLKQVYNIDYNFPLTVESVAKPYWGG